MMNTVLASLLLFALVVGAFAESCKNNCLSNKCDACHCGTEVAMRIVICQKYAGWDQAACQCAMRVASGSNAHAISMNNDGTASVGLFMVNSALWGSCSNGEAPCAVEQNLQCAIEMFKQGGNTFDLFSNAGACEPFNTTNTTTTRQPTHATGTHATGTHATGTHATGTHATGTHATGTHATVTHATVTHATVTHATGTHGQPTHAVATHGGPSATHGGPSGPSATHGGPSGPSSTHGGSSGPSGPSGPSATSATSGSSSQTTQSSSSTYGAGMEGLKGGVGRLGKTAIFEVIVKGERISARSNEKSIRKFDF